MYENYFNDLFEAACKDLGKESKKVKETFKNREESLFLDNDIYFYLRDNLKDYYFSTKTIDKNSEVWKVINKFHNSHPNINAEIYTACKKVFEEACKRLNLTGYTFEEYLDYNPSENDLKTSQFQAIEKYIEDHIRNLIEEPSSDFYTLKEYLFKNNFFNQYQSNGLPIFRNFSDNGFRALSTRMKNLPKSKLYEPSEERFKLLIEAAIKDLGIENLDYETYSKLNDLESQKSKIFNYVYYSINAYYLGNNEERREFINKRRRSNLYKAIKKNQLENKEEIDDTYNSFLNVFNLVLKKLEIRLYDYDYQQFLNDYSKNTTEVQKIKNFLEEQFRTNSDSDVAMAINELKEKSFFNTYSKNGLNIRKPSTCSEFLNFGYIFYILKKNNIKKEKASSYLQNIPNFYIKPLRKKTNKENGTLNRGLNNRRRSSFSDDLESNERRVNFNNSRENTRKFPVSRFVQPENPLKKQLKSVLILANGISLGLGAWAVGANYLVYGGTLFNPAALAAFFTVPAATLAGTAVSKVRKIFKNSKRRHEYKERKEDFSENDFENEYSKEQEKENEEELSFEEQMQDDIFKDQGIEQLEQDRGYEEQDIEESEYDDGYEEQESEETEYGNEKQDLTRAHETLTATREEINKLNMRIAKDSEYLAFYDTELEEIEDRLFGPENLSKLETLKLNIEYKKNLENRNFWAKDIEKNENRIRSLNEDIQELSPERENYEDMDEFGYDDDSEYENEEEMGRSG